MEKIASFTVDHIKLQPGIYVSRKDQVGDSVITTFDIRMTSPNEEPVMNTAELHTIEHLAATYLRNQPEFKDRVIYWGPMGCRTGNYLLLNGDYESKDIVPLMIETMAKKLEEASLLPAKIVKSQVFGKQFHTICSGGAYLDPAYIDLFNKYDITILQGYGMTECSPVISTTVSWNIRKDAVGQLIPNCEAKTVDGELWVKGSSVMQGYYKMPEETAETLEDGWLKTGDLGYVDEDDFVYLTGRKKNLIITKNGENVSPEELENILSTNRLVGEILVREKNGVIEAEIYPDQDYVKKKRIKDVRAALQDMIDAYNKTAAPQKKIYSLIVRDTEFEKTTTRKIKRF